MMNKVTHIKCIIIALFISGYAQGQIGTLFKTNEDRGDSYYNDFAYTEAIEEYKVAMTKAPNNQLPLKIAESYRKLNDPANSTIWYGKAIENEVSDPITYMHYAEALSSLERYEEAKRWYEKYSTLVKDDERPKQKIKAIDNLSKFKDRSTEITLEKAPFNSDASDFSPEFYEDEQIVFASSRSSGKALANIFKWDNSEYLNLYVVDKNNTVKLFQEQISTKYHEGPISIYDQNRKMIFTRNNYLDKSLGADNEGITKLKLYTASRDSVSGWGKAKEFKYNSSEYSVGHPAVTEDGRVLIFASDMPGGYGGTDLYKSEWINGQWSEPVNLGAQVNTSGNELFLYLTASTQLFFSSDGQGGFGGLDIFGIDLSVEKSKPINLGKPLNSSFDDFGLIINGDSGYFSSNREGGKSNDDIYSFKTISPLLLAYTLKVVTVDSATQKPVAGTTVRLLESGAVLSEATTDTAGEFIFNIDPLGEYEIEANKEGFESHRMPVAINANKLEITSRIGMKHKSLLDSVQLAKNENALAGTGNEHSSAVFVKTIYFDLSKFQIRADAEKELDEVAKLMVEDKNIRVELNSHTDSRGNSKFNLQLSAKRFNATAKYLTAKGVERSRITGQGNGEKMLVNQCKDGVTCTDEEHQLNRRTEVKLFRE